MKVLCLISRDAANFALEQVLIELTKREHLINLYSLNKGENNMRMFFRKGIKFNIIDTLSDEIIDENDIIIAANDTVWRVIDSPKIIFTVNMASVFGNFLSEGGDIMFMPSYQFYRRGKEKNISVVVGNAKSSTEDLFSIEDNYFLFIDSGHYPFGKKGKHELAKTLLSICEKFPEKKLIIKPRFLKSDIDITHKNRCHLYDVIEYECNHIIPGNMILLESHKDMNTLIRHADVVICMYTSAFFDAISLGKRAIILGGLPNEDSFGLSIRCIWNIQKEILEESGCVIDYKEVLEYLPYGIECNEKFVNKHIPCFGTKEPSEHIADIIEYLYSNYISLGKFIKRVDTDANNYLQDFEETESVDWEIIRNDRYYNAAMYLFERRFDSIGLDIDAQIYKNWINENISVMINNPDFSYSKLAEAVYKRGNKIILDSYEEIKGDDLLESCWLEAFFNTSIHRFGELSSASFKCKRSFMYLWALYCFEKHMYVDAYFNFKKYIEETQELEFEKYNTDRENCLNNAKEKILDLFPFSVIERGSKLVLYGAGNWGRHYYSQIKNTNYCTVVAIADKNADKMVSDEVNYILPNEIEEYEYDYVVITVKDENVSDVIERELREKYHIDNIISRFQIEKELKFIERETCCG